MHNKKEYLNQLVSYCKQSGWHDARLNRQTLSLTFNSVTRTAKIKFDNSVNSTNNLFIPFVSETNSLSLEEYDYSFIVCSVSSNCYILKKQQLQTLFYDADAFVGKNRFRFIDKPKVKGFVLPIKVLELTVGYKLIEYNGSEMVGTTYEGNKAQVGFAEKLQQQ